MAFSETVSPIAAIQAILHDYPYSASILREFLQNSDDAGATKQVFVLDKGNNPALLAYNDSQFRDTDWQAIQSIHSSFKRADMTKIGKYGVGFRACYHITDGPQILSGSSFAILDPLHSNGMKMDYQTFKTTEHFKHFHFFLDISDPFSFPGTVIRLPLRSSRSELSQRVVRADELRQMIADYIADELNISLLFLDNLRKIEIWESRGDSKARLAMWTKSERASFSRDPSLPLITYDSVLSSDDTEHAWRIVQTQNSEGEVIARLIKLAQDDSVSYIVKKHKLRCDVRIAYPLIQNERISGRLFTFLPLPSKTSFPVHVHALFALTSSRQSLRNANETGIVQGSDNDVLIRWNHLLFDHYIPQAWSYLLKTLAEEATCNDILSAWPPYCSSITSGDGLYWQNVLKSTFKLVIDSGLKVWPKVSFQGTTSTIYVDLKSVFILRRGMLERNVLSVLTELGLVLVQLPQNLFELAERYAIKLSPSVAHRKLQNLLNNFEKLSVDQRGALRRYLLSDKDICHIYGLPLIPTLNGSFVALDHRDTSSERFIMLTNDEAEIFRASAHDAIVLGQLEADVAHLIREQGPVRANVDLLNPQVVIGYLTKELQPPSDERILEFWRWLGKWHLRTELINLLKGNSTLCLVPTSRGPQPFSSSIFKEGTSMAWQLFGKLGLASISPVLPPSMVRLLDKHNIIKNINDLNDLLAAVRPASIPSLTDGEAQSLFHHVTASYQPPTSDNIENLRKLPIFPVIMPNGNGRTGSGVVNFSSITWRNIHQINVKGVSPIKLVPVVNIYFLDEPCIKDPSCSVLKALQIRVWKEEEVLLLALEKFSSQSKPLQAMFISYIKGHQDRLPMVKQTLQRAPLIRASDNSAQAPKNIIDPNSKLIPLFPPNCRDPRIARIEDSYDKQMLTDLRAMDFTLKTLTADLVLERISYISSNSTSDECMTIAHALLHLMNKPSFSCSRLSIDANLRWLPTSQGLVGPRTCINNRRRDTDLFDEVLVTLDPSISTSASFRALLNWDQPLPLGILTEQFHCVLDLPKSETQSRKAQAMIRELASRKLCNADLQKVQEVIAGRPWVPSKSGILVPHTRAVFAVVPVSSGFHEVVFSVVEKDIYRFLLQMGCQEKPTAAAIIGQLTALRDQPGGSDGTAVLRAVQLLELLPEFMTEEEWATVLVPGETGNLVLLSSGICYYGSGRVDAEDDGPPIAHHLVTEGLAEKLRMNRLGLDVEDDIDLGEKPITTIRNILKQYDPKQFFTEFVANASDAKAKRFGILIDEHEGPTECLFSKATKDFQGASLVVYNDGVFTNDDLKGIRETGIGGKRGQPDVIGHFGLGALSMFHFTELAMIVSGSHVLFLNPAKQHLGYRGKNAVLLQLQLVKRLYADHLEPLNGLFGFNLDSSVPYPATLFRLPLRKPSHLASDPVLTKSWPPEEIRDVFLAQFDDQAQKSLMFTALTRIEILSRRDSQPEILRSIECDRAPDSSVAGIPFKCEVATFRKTDEQQRWFILSKSLDMPEQFRKTLGQKYSTRHFLPMQIAAPLDNAQAMRKDRNLFCALPLPVLTSLPIHVSAPFILEQERRNVRLDNLGTESEYNRWLLTSEVPDLYLSLLEILLEKQGTNEVWWPPTRKGRNDGDSMASQIIIDTFWTPEVLGSSTKGIFSNRDKPSTAISPKDAVLLLKTHSHFGIISRILDLSKPVNVVELPSDLHDDANRAKLAFINATFVRKLLEDAHVCQQLSKDEKKLALMILCSSDKLGKEFWLHGLPLLPLEDGSDATISNSKSARKYYVIEQNPNEDYPPFRKNRLVCRKLKPFLLNNGHLTSWKRISVGYNISPLSEEGIIELVKESIQPVDELVGDESHESWVKAFWNARLRISSEAVSHFPLVPTLKPSYFISLRKTNDMSVIVLEKPNDKDNCDDILQDLGLTIVVRSELPLELRDHVSMKKSSVYSAFLRYMLKNPAKLKTLRELDPKKRNELSKWVLSKFSKTPDDCVSIAWKLPVWPVRRDDKDIHLALNDVTILPKEMSPDIIRPFTDHAIIAWRDEMKGAVREPCGARHIMELLRVALGTPLENKERGAYKWFIKAFVKLNKVEGFKLNKIGNFHLPLPDERYILRRASDLFERDELFTTTFKSESHRLLAQDFNDLAPELEEYGLNCQRCLDLSLFIECAEVFDMDREYNKQTRSGILYENFNRLRLSPQDAQRCRELDHLKFIPRADSPRQGYGTIDTAKYMVHLPQHLLAPSQITVPEFESVCWSQKGRTHTPPNMTLRGTYQSLGRPSGADVLAHLKVLSKIAEEHDRHPKLLSDLKDTYKWLNDHAEDIRGLLGQRRSDKIFLNVNDPVKDDWVWHSASSLVMDLQDIYDTYNVKNFLRNYNQLMNAAAIRRIEKRTISAIPVSDKTLLLQGKYSEMRRRGFATDIVFEARDDKYQISPAHSDWLSANSIHFWNLFVLSCIPEAKMSGHNEGIKLDVSEFSSACVKEVIDWIYVGKLSGSLVAGTNNLNEKDARTRLDLGLEMLALCHKWQLTELHEHLQVFIINDPHFLNPYWVRHIRKCAQAAVAMQLLAFCLEYEEKNQSVMDDLQNDI